MTHKPYHVRTSALQVLHAVLVDKDKAKTTFEHVVAQQAWESRDISLLRNMVYGVLRHYYVLEADVSRFIRQKPDDYARLALLLGAYQLRYMRVPEHAAVSEVVSAIKVFSPRASGFVNAVLRQVVAHDVPCKYKPHQRAELPKWIYSLWRDAFSSAVTQEIGEVCQHTPDLCLATFVERGTWMKHAADEGVVAYKGDLSPYAVLLSHETAVSSLPAYESGGFVVMDQAAQTAVMALNMAKDDGVLLDLCAAPGGKTGLLAHRFPQAQLIAIELNDHRIPRLQENLQRLRQERVCILNADCAALPFADQSADAIMLDAPCTASGTFRRHPDAKFLHDADDVVKASALQKQLLIEALRVLKVGGTLIYAVCSIHPAENEDVVGEVAGLVNMQRLLPCAAHDGFFFAEIRKDT